MSKTFFMLRCALLSIWLGGIGLFAWASLDDSLSMLVHPERWWGERADPCLLVRHRLTYTAGRGAEAFLFCLGFAAQLWAFRKWRLSVASVAAVALAFGLIHAYLKNTAPLSEVRAIDCEQLWKEQYLETTGAKK